MELELLSTLRGRKENLWRVFLEEAGLEPDPGVARTALIWEDGALVAAGSRQGNLLKCIAVAPTHQGEGLTATLITALRQDAFRDGYRHLFLYTKPGNEFQFSSLFFYPVAQTDRVLLMESRKDGIRQFVDALPEPPEDGIVGAAVMHCNPFTLGHRYLIEKAAGECRRLYVFVLSEAGGQFSPEERMAMVKAGTADLENVTVLPTGPYLLSAATFPTYFLKEKERLPKIQCELDIAVFARYFAPKLGITRRYVGTEPLSPSTQQYNLALKEQLPQWGIDVREVPRLEQGAHPVSASRVRSLLAEGRGEEIRRLVPPTTWEYLQVWGYL